MWYEYPTNFSNGTSVTGVGSYLQYAAYVTDYWLGYAILLIIFLITFTTGALVSSRKALLASSFITFIFAVYLLRIDLVNPVVVFILVVGMIIGALGSKGEGQY